MAKFQGPAPGSGRNFRRVASKPTSRGRRNRKPAFANVLPSGLVEFGANACDLLDAMAVQAGLPASAYAIGFGADDDGNQISVYVERPNTPGSAGFVRHADTRQYTFSVADVFEESPSLRPDVRRKCSVVPSADATDTPCLVITLNSSLEFLTTPRNTKKSTASAQKPTSTENTPK